MGSLQFRLFLTYLVIIFVTLGLAALGLYLLIGGYRDSVSYSSLDDIGRLIEVQANAEVRDALSRGEAPPAGADLVLALRSFLVGRGDNDREGTAIAVVDREGRVMAGWSASPVSLEGARVERFRSPDPADPRETVQCRLSVPGEGDLLCVMVPLGETLRRAFPSEEATALVVAQPSASLRAVFGDLFPRLLASGLIGVAAALILGFLLSQSVAAPLRNIARAARNVARGNYRQRVPVTGPTEVRDLAQNFNRMTEQVQRSQQTLRDFLANISHELKTPLTSIRGFSEAILDGTIDDPEGIQRSARVISGESNRVLRLVEELLDLSRIESGQVAMRLQEFPLRELVEQVGDVFALRSEESGVALEVSCEGEPRVRGDFDRLEQVLNNLMDNAFRHTPRGGNVRVEVRQPTPHMVQVAVTDTGTGIDAADLPHLFDRFYRASGSAVGRGYGLGLAIAREIIRAHGGEIWATSERGQGSAFVFTLPLVTGAVAAAKVRS